MTLSRSDIGKRNEYRAMRFLKKLGYTKILRVNKTHDLEAFNGNKKILFEVKTFFNGIKKCPMHKQQYEHVLKNRVKLIVVRESEIFIVDTSKIKNYVCVGNEYKFTINIFEDTKVELNKIGKKGETYDTIIKRLLKKK